MLEYSFRKWFDSLAAANWEKPEWQDSLNTQSVYVPVNNFDLFANGGGTATASLCRWTHDEVVGGSGEIPASEIVSACLKHIYKPNSLWHISLLSHLIPLFSAVVLHFPSQTETVLLWYPSRRDKAQTCWRGRVAFPKPSGASQKRACSGWPGKGFSSLKYCKLVLLGEHLLVQWDWQVNRGLEVLQLKCSIWEQILKDCEIACFLPHLATQKNGTMFDLNMSVRVRSANISVLTPCQYLNRSEQIRIEKKILFIGEVER